MVSYIIAFLAVVGIVGIDQYTKYIISTTMCLGDSKTFLKGVLDICFIENSGSAWGMLSGHTWILLALTLVVMLVCITLLLRHGSKSKILFWAIILILAGGIGNMIDRIFRSGKVVDFLQFGFWKTFPVFNIADIFVVIGAGMLILYFFLDMYNDYKSKKSTAISSRENKNNNEEN